jgi:hypothetical protein
MPKAHYESPRKEAGVVDPSVEDILREKARRMYEAMVQGEKYWEHIRWLLENKELKIAGKMDTALLGAIDAMVYDVACSLDFTKQKGSVSDWSSHKRRRAFLAKWWPRRFVAERP